MPSKKIAPKKLVYFGTPDEAVPPLKALAEDGYEILLVVTGKDKPRGRGRKVSPTPVKLAAQELGLETTHEPSDVIGIGADLGVVVAYGRLIKADVLAEMTFINMHFSLLPRWRGAAPVERAILEGDGETGVCLMKLEAELDTGPIYVSAKTPINDEDTALSLKTRLVDMGTELLLNLLKGGQKNKALPKPVPQEGEPTWAEKIQPTDFQINPNRAVEDAARQVKIGGAWVMVNGKRLKILDAEVAYLKQLCGEHQRRPGDLYFPERGAYFGAYPVLLFPVFGLVLKEVQPEGKKAMSGADWYRGISSRAEVRAE